jgi:hypothetical protein
MFVITVVNRLTNIKYGNESFKERMIMTEIEKQRIERCSKCSKSAEEDDWEGGTELYCPLHGYPCNDIIQCVYIADNKRYE